MYASLALDSDGVSDRERPLAWPRTQMGSQIGREAASLASDSEFLPQLPKRRASPHSFRPVFVK